MLASHAIATTGPPKHCGLPSSLAAHHPKLALGYQNLALPSQRFVVVRADTKEDRSTDDNESKAILEAFFLGKAFAEALTERLGTAVGEFLSDIGRWQAEQQRQVLDFQEEVQARARAAKLKAVREAEAVKTKTQIRSSDNEPAPSSASASNGSFVSSAAKPTATPESKDS